MRRLNTGFAQRNRFFNQTDLRGIIAQLAPSFDGLDQFFNDYLGGTRELDYETYLGYAGLGLLTAEVERGALGFRLNRHADGVWAVQSVDPGGTADRAGLKRGDTVIQLNAHKPTDSANEELARVKPGEKIELTIRRDSQEIKFKSIASTQVETEYRIVESPNPSPQQLEVRRGWLEGMVSSAGSN
jgi:predicted metalloprotease with PDZ domain